MINESVQFINLPRVSNAFRKEACVMRDNDPGTEVQYVSNTPEMKSIVLQL